MSKAKSPDLPEQQDSAHSINIYITGEPIPVEIEDVTLYIRQPSYLERDQADFKESLFERNIEVESEEIKFLKDSPAPQSEIDAIKDLISLREEMFNSEEDEVRKRVLNDRINFMYEVIEGRDAARSLLETYSARAKMRWYARTLVVDDKGNPVDYDKLHPAVQDIVMSAVDSMIEDIDKLPLASA